MIRLPDDTQFRIHCTTVKPPTHLFMSAECPTDDSFDSDSDVILAWLCSSVPGGTVDSLLWKLGSSIEQFRTVAEQAKIKMLTAGSISILPSSTSESAQLLEIQSLKVLP